MVVFMIIAFTIFLMFGKNIVITYNAVTSAINPEARAKSVTIFSAFMITCLVIWLAFKYAYKPIAFVAVCLVTIWCGNKYDKHRMSKLELELERLKKEKGEAV